MRKLLALALTLALAPAAFALGNSKPLTKPAFDKLMKSIKTRTGGGSLSNVHVRLLKNGEVSTWGNAFLGPGGGTVHFNAKADTSGKIVKGSFSTGEPQ
jgi:hypothetical protein